MFQTVRCVWVKRFYANNLLFSFLPCLGQLLLWKHFICHYIALKTLTTNINHPWIFNPFVPSAPFLYHLKTSENRKVFWCFQEVQKGCIGNEWVKLGEWNNRPPVYQFLKFLLACRFTFNVYAKNVREKRSALSEMLRFYWMLMDMCLPKFDIDQSTVAPNCFKSHTNSWCPDFFQKKNCLIPDLKFTLPDITSFLPDNLSGLYKKRYSGLLDGKLCEDR